MKKKIKVFMGLVEIASFFQTIKPYLQEYDFLDVKTANLYSSYLDYKEGIDYNLALNRLDSVKAKVKFKEFIKEHFFKYDIYDFNFSSFKTNFRDLKELKENGKYIVYRGVGSDIRNFKILNYVNLLQSDLIYEKVLFTNENQRESLYYINKYADIITTINTPIFLVKKFIPYYVPIDVNKLKYTGIDINKKRLKVIHSPTSREKKGSDFILPVLKDLSAKGIIDFKLIEGLSYKQALKEYEKADIAIDQLSSEGFGKFTLEMLSMGKVVICQDYYSFLDKFYPDIPIIKFATPFNLSEILIYFNNNREKLKELSLKTRQYVEKYNLAKNHAKELAYLYKDLAYKKDIHHIINPLYKYMQKQTPSLDRKEGILVLDMLNYNNNLNLVLQVFNKKDLDKLKKFITQQKDENINIYILTNLKFSKRNKIFNLVKGKIKIFSSLKNLVLYIKDKDFIYVDLSSIYHIDYLQSFKKILFSYNKVFKKEKKADILIIDPDFNKLDFIKLNKLKLSSILFLSNSICEKFLQVVNDLKLFLFLNIKALVLKDSYIVYDYNFVKFNNLEFKSDLKFIPLNYFKDLSYNFTLIFYFKNDKSFKNFELINLFIERFNLPFNIIFLVDKNYENFIDEFKNLNLPNLTILKTDEKDVFSNLRDLKTFINSSYILFWDLTYKVSDFKFLDKIYRFLFNKEDILVYTFPYKNENEFNYGYIKIYDKYIQIKDDKKLSGFINKFLPLVFIANRKIIKYLKNRERIFDEINKEKEKIYLIADSILLDFKNTF